MRPLLSQTWSSRFATSGECRPPGLLAPGQVGAREDTAHVLSPSQQVPEGDRNAALLDYVECGGPQLRRWRHAHGRSGCHYAYQDRCPGRDRH